MRDIVPLRVAVHARPRPAVEHDSSRNAGESPHVSTYTATDPPDQVAFTLMGIEGIAQEIEMPFVRAPPVAFPEADLAVGRVATNQTCHSVR